MAQQIINTGAVANDGTGDPLRTAFTETNDNFTEIYTAGPVGSNVRIVDNTILTINTNGNLVLAPNGTGKVVANVDIVPNQANVRNLGGSARRWSTLYLQYADISNTVTVGGGLTVGGNLTVSGNIIQVGNIITDSLTIQLGNTAATSNAANGAGITVGANDNIATILYNSTSNAWTTNIGVSAVGNISGANIRTTGTVSATGNVNGNYFVGNGSQLTGLSSYSNANVATFLAAYGNNIVSTTGNITAGNIIATNVGNIASLNLNSNASTVLYGNGTFASLPASYGNSNVTTLLGNLGSNVISSTGNITTTANISGGYILGNGSQLTSLPAPTVAQDITSVGAMSIMTYDGNLKYASYATIEPVSGNIIAGNISTTGNIIASNVDTVNLVVNNISSDDSTLVSVQDGLQVYGDIIADNFIGNGNQLTGLNALSYASPASGTAIDLTKQLATLDAGFYTLADGAEGQILYLALRSGAKNSVTVAFANVRIYSDGSISSSYPINVFNPATAGLEASAVFCIFTNGAWSISNGDI